MYQAGGIDKLISQKADAFRKNPEALSQQAQISGDLIAAIADQKLKKEKMEAQRQVALMAQQNPNTIVAQNEQALAAMSKDDIVKQTTGILGERQKAAQQKQQAMGIPPQQPQGQPQGQRPPMPQGAPPQGIAGQPRPNMQGMAGGGIIGYKEGDKVKTPTKEDIAKLPKYSEEDSKKRTQQTAADARLRAKLADLGITAEKWATFSDADKKNTVAAMGVTTNIDEAIEGVGDFLGTMVGMLPTAKLVQGAQYLGRSISESPTGIALGLSEPGAEAARAAEAKAEAARAEAKAQQRTPETVGGVESLLARGSQKPTVGVGPGVLKEEAPLGEFEALLAQAKPVNPVPLSESQGSMPAAPAAPAAPPAATPPGGGVLTPAALKAREAAGAGAGAGAGGLDSIEIGTAPKFSQTKVSDAVDPEVKKMMDAKLAADPTTARDAEQKRLNEFYRREKYDKANVDVNAEIEALRKSQTSPENEREQRRRAMILGTIKGGRLGGGLEAVENTRSNQAKSRMDRLEKKRANVLETQKADFEIAKQIGTGALGMYTAIADAQNKAMELSINMTEADIAAGQTAYTNWYNRQSDNIKAKLKDRELTLTSELQTLVKNSQATQNSQELNLKIVDSRNKAVETYEESQQLTIDPIKAKIRDGKELTPEEAKAFNNYKVGMEAVQEPYTTLLDTLFKAVVKENPNATATAAGDPSASAKDQKADSYL
jgi:hypothetical protein